MKYIYLIAAFNAFFFTALMLRKKKALHDKILIGWLIYLGVCTATYGLFAQRLFSEHHLLSAAFISLLLLHGPFLYLYIRALTDEKFRIRMPTVYHFLPFLLFNLYLLNAFLLTPASRHISLEHIESTNRTPALFNLFLILTVLSGPVYFLLTISRFKKMNISLLNNFSAVENIDPGWLKKLVYSFGSVWTILMIAAVLHHVFHFYSLRFCTDSLFLALSIFVILIGYFGLKQKEIFVHYHYQPDHTGSADKTKYKDVFFNPDEAKELSAKIKIYMLKEKPHLATDITLPEMARRLNVPAHHLSRVINENLGLNFFEFINHYRVEEVKSKMKNPAYENFSLLGIAYESGFNTKSAFNRVFKKMTGITPSEYKKQNSHIPES